MVFTTSSGKNAHFPSTGQGPCFKAQKLRRRRPDPRATVRKQSHPSRQRRALRRAQCPVPISTRLCPQAAENKWAVGQRTTNVEIRQINLKGNESPETGSSAGVLTTVQRFTGHRWLCGSQESAVSRCFSLTKSCFPQDPVLNTPASLPPTHHCLRSPPSIISNAGSDVS